MSEYAYEHCPLYSAKDKLIKGFTVNDYALEELKYRWEFLRRNKGYKQDYDKSSDEVEGFRELKSLSEAGFAELNFCKKWRIGVPVHPKKKFDELRRDVGKEVKDSIAFDKRFFGEVYGKRAKEQFIRLFLESILKPVDYFLSPVSGWEQFLFTDEQEILMGNDEHLKRFRNKGEVNFTINLNYSRNAIENEFSKILKIFSKEYKSLDKKGKVFSNGLEIKINKYERKTKEPTKAENDRYKENKSQLNKVRAMLMEQKSTKQNIKEQDIIPRQRKEFNSYDDYLKIWDLYQKLGNKWTQIAKKAFDDDKGEDKGKTKAMEAYKIAESLINDMSLGFSIFKRSKRYTF